MAETHRPVRLDPSNRLKPVGPGDTLAVGVVAIQDIAHSTATNVLVSRSGTDLVLADPGKTMALSQVGGVKGIAAGASTLTGPDLAFANANGVTFGVQNGSQITASFVQGAAAGVGAIEDGNGDQVAGTVRFGNANGITFGLSGQTITAQGGGAALAANGGTISAGTAVFSNANGISFGVSGSTITASGGGGVDEAYVAAFMGV